MIDETLLDKFGIGQRMGLLVYWLIGLLWTLLPIFFVSTRKLTMHNLGVS